MRAILASVLLIALSACASYTPSPYVGRVTLFRTDHGGPRHDPRMGWDKLARGGLDVKRIPGSHMTLLRPPNVEVFAGMLRESLDEIAGSLEDGEDPLGLAGPS